MFVRGLLALEERRRVRADRVVRPYEWLIDGAFVIVDKEISYPPYRAVTNWE